MEALVCRLKMNWLNDVKYKKTEHCRSLKSLVLAHFPIFSMKDDPDSNKKNGFYFGGSKENNYLCSRTKKHYYEIPYRNTRF